jgi:hypothetical protein
MQEVKPTWKFAWGLWWKMMVITLGIYAIIFIIVLIVGAAAILPFLGNL